MVHVHGVVKYCNLGHWFVDVVLTMGESHVHIRHLVGVDIKPNRGKIITFLGNLYEIPPGQIDWPAHIELESGV